LGNAAGTVNENSPGLAAELVAYIQVLAGFFGTVATVAVAAGTGVTLNFTVAPVFTHIIGGFIGFGAAEARLIFMTGLTTATLHVGICSVLQSRAGAGACGAQAAANTLIGIAKRIFIFIVVAPV
jgi:hypothetical protein